MKIVIKEKSRIVLKPLNTPKVVVFMLCAFLSVFIWRNWNATKQMQKYHNDCIPLLRDGQPTNACYETEAQATYEEDRSKLGKVYWYDIRIKLPDGNEIITSPLSLNPPRFLNAESMNGACYVRIWRGKIVNIRNSRINFATQDNPETMFDPQSILIIGSFLAIWCIFTLSYDIYSKRRQRNANILDTQQDSKD